MDTATRERLTSELSDLVGDIAADLLEQITGDEHDPAVRARAQQLYEDERVGEDLAVWADLLARRAAVLWVLKSVYVRVLEDRNLLSPLRIVDRESQDLFAHLAPNLGDSAYLTWVYRDLSTDEAGLGELFARQPAEVAVPADALSRRLLDFWRRTDPDTGGLRYEFTAEHFDGRLMGDLYQDLDPVVKARYALLQTPDFVVDFILDETLTPAIDEWGIETVRVLDPSCGSGHFLLAAFDRLVTGLQRARPDWPIIKTVRHVLDRVVGIDINDYACALARARLVMTALERCGASALSEARDLHPRVYWADALEQVERDEPKQGDVFEEPDADAMTATFTRPEVRAVLRPALKTGFHIVVGNPPYITERDKRTKRYHRQKTSDGRRYKSAYREYSLAAPFIERCFQFACGRGFVGLITTNAFMKRLWGKALIEEVLCDLDVFKIVDTSGVIIHGVATVIIFGRASKPISPAIRCVLGRKQA